MILFLCDINSIDYEYAPPHSERKDKTWNESVASERITKHNVGYSYEVEQTPAGD
ncbi:hypothetical protein VB740_32040 [Nostoc sp. UHCC 0251]|nr:hypothetical protein [Nostoc sp. UHCC 0251]